MMWDSRISWEKKEVADEYAKRSFLCKPEEVVLKRFRDEWKCWSVLDLGVGGGRTSQHFGPWAQRYVGSDFSNAMISRCRNRFPHYEFYVDDARAMKFPSQTFDFVAFSYNGLGELPESEIPKAIREIK